MTPPDARQVTVRDHTYTYSYQNRHGSETYIVSPALHEGGQGLQDEIVTAILTQRRPGLTLRSGGGRLEVVGSGIDIFFEFTDADGRRVFRSF